MKNSFKKIISLLLVIVIVIGAVPLTGFVGLELPELSSLVGIKASATSVYEKDGFSYIIEDDFVKIIDFDTTISGVIVVPSTINGKTVNEISNHAFYDCTNITKITLPATIETIGSYAFYNCESLAQINLPNSITEIGSRAFEYCDLLDNITLPANISAIKESTFYRCTSLTKITIHKNISRIESNAFFYCSNLSEISVHDELIHIGANAFAGTKFYSDKSNWNDRHCESPSPLKRIAIQQRDES